MNRRSFLLSALTVAGGGFAVGAEQPLIGGLFVTGFRGTEVGDGDVDVVRRMLASGECAGVILMRRNCTSPEQLARLTLALREAAGDFTPVISIDQEGGRVARLDAQNGFLDWRSAGEMSLMAYSDEDMMEYWSKRAAEMSSVGINVNFAPVVDLNVNPRNPIIGKLERAFGSTPGEVLRFARVFIAAHRAAGLKTSLKHFPGHGSSTKDTHDAFADVSGTWHADELIPFAGLVSEGLADSIMNAHLLHPRFSDEPNLPASLSSRAVKAIREEVGFSGAIFTDDMQMFAVEEALPFEAAAIAAVNAGNTFMIYSNYRRDDSIDTVKRAAAALSENVPLLDATSLASQVASAKEFRRTLK